MRKNGAHCSTKWFGDVFGHLALVTAKLYFTMVIMHMICLDDVLGVNNMLTCYM